MIKMMKKLLIKLLIRTAFQTVEALVIEYASRKKPELVDELEALFDEIERVEKL